MWTALEQSTGGDFSEALADVILGGGDDGCLWKAFFFVCVFGELTSRFPVVLLLSFVFRSHLMMI